MVTIVKDIDLFKHLDGYDAIMFGTNTYCMLSGDFPRRVSLNYPYVDKSNISTKYGDNTKLGSIQVAEGEPTFILLYIVGWPTPSKEEDWANYDAIERCCRIVNAAFRGKNIACPRIGSYKWDGNGNLNRVIEIMNRTLKDVDVTLYDYAPLSRKEEYTKSRERALKIQEELGKDAYLDYMRKIREERKRVLEINGHAKGL